MKHGIIVEKNGHVINMTTRQAMSVIDAPSRSKQEYHGNGKNACYDNTYLFRFPDEDKTFTVERKSHRYSYRFHKTEVRINGQVPTAKMYAEFRKKVQ
jgi:hypothetical protein